MNEYYLSDEKINTYFMKLIPDFSVFDIAERSCINNENNDLFYYADIPTNVNILKNISDKCRCSVNGNTLILNSNIEYEYNIDNMYAANLEIELITSFKKDIEYIINFESTCESINEEFLLNTNEPIIIDSSLLKNNKGFKFTSTNDNLNKVKIGLLNNITQNNIGKILFSIFEIDKTLESKKEKRASLLTTTPFYRAIFKIIGIPDQKISLLKSIDNNILVKKYFINGDMYIIVISRGSEIIDLNKIIDINSDINIDFDIKVIGVAF